MVWLFFCSYIHSFKIPQFLPQEGRNLNKPMFSSWNACGLPGVGGGAGGNVEVWIDLLIILRLSWFSYITCFHLEYCYSPWTGLMLIHYRLPPSEAFFQACLTVCWYPFILQWKGKGHFMWERSILLKNTMG